MCVVIQYRIRIIMNHTVILIAMLFNIQIASVGRVR